MATAWKALEQAATAAGAPALDPAIWEVTLQDGTVATICREPHLVQSYIGGRAQD